MVGNRLISRSTQRRKRDANLLRLIAQRELPARSSDVVTLAPSHKVGDAAITEELLEGIDIIPARRRERVALHAVERDQIHLHRQALEHLGELDRIAA